MPPAAARPLWLLDIDGVINAVGRPGTGAAPAWPDAQWVRVRARTTVDGAPAVFGIRSARPVLEFITRVAAESLAEIHWHSTWRESVNEGLARELGLPVLGISHAPEWADTSGRGWWKLAAAQRAVASGRPLVWTDDDLAGYRQYDLRAGAILERMAEHENLLLISPDVRIGLTPDDLVVIEQFLRRYQTPISDRPTDAGPDRPDCP